MDKQFILNKQLVDCDWIYCISQEELEQNNNGKVFVDYSVWHKLDNTSPTNSYPVITDTDNTISVVWPEIKHLSAIGILFTDVKAGIGYSNARMLREEYDYKGNIHAIGNIGYDQLCFMDRCGINAFHLDNQHDLVEALKYFNDVQFTYQR